MTRRDAFTLERPEEGGTPLAGAVGGASLDSAVLAAMEKASTVGMVVTDAGGVVLRANPAFCWFAGFAPSELVGRSMLGLLHADDVEPEQARRLAALGNGADRGAAGNGAHHFQAVWRGLRADGPLRLLCHTTLVQGADGEHVFVSQLFELPTAPWDGLPVQGGALTKQGEAIRRDNLQPEDHAAFAAIFIDNPVPLALISIEDLRYLDVNERFAQATGYRRDELIGRTSEEIGLWSKPEQRQSYREQLVRHGYVRDFEFEFRTKAGDLRDAQLSATLVTFRGRRCILAQASDITEHRAMLSALHQREQAFRALVENSPDLISRYNLEGQRIYVNPALARALGRPARELLGKGPHEHPIVEGSDWFLELLRGVAQRGEECQMEVRYQAHGEAPRWAHLRAVPEFGPDGKVCSILSIGRDIQALKESARQMQVLLEALPDPIARFDTDGRFTYVGSTTTRLLGVPADMLIGKTLLGIGPQLGIGDPAHLHASILQAAQGVANQTEGDIITVAGRRQHEIRHVPITDENGTVVSVLGICRDVTAQRQADRELGRLNRALQLLSACRMALVQAESEQQLLDQVCRLIVTVGRYGMCWVGYLQDDEAESVLPVAHHDTLHPLPDGDAVLVTGPAGIRDDHATSFLDAGAGDGYESSIALPLRDGAQVLGALNIYATEPDAFHCEELALFEELTDSLVFGILALRVRDQQRKAEERLMLMGRALSEVRDAVFLIDDDGRFRYVNNQACLSLGYEHDELVGMSVPDIDDDWTADRVFATFQAQPPGTRKVVESYHRRKDGHRFPVEINISFFQHQGWRYNLALARDITERRQLEAARQESEARYRQIFDNSTDALYLLEVTEDDRFRYIEVNPQFERICGVERAHMVGKYAPATLTGESAKRVLDKYRRCVEAGATIEQELEVTTLAGTGVFHSMLVPVREDTGRIYRIVGVIRDITEQKRADAILHTREQEFRAFVEKSPDPIVRYDAQCRRLYLNPVAHRNTGLPMSDLLDRTPTETSHGNTEGARLLERHIREVIEKGEPTSCAIAWRAADGRKLHFDLRLVPEFDPAGKLVSVLSIGRDIQALKEAEQCMQASHDLLRELAARRETAREEERKHIAREVHDELGQILTALRIDVSMLRLKFAANNPPLLAHVQRMFTTVDRTIQVVRDVAAKLRPAVLDMGVVPAIEWLIAEFTRMTGVACRLHVEGGDAALDEQQATVVFRIVQESLTNVARHAQASQVSIVLRASADSYWISVCDNGRGFTPSAPTGKSFGLISMRERAIMLGGDIDIASEPGRGTDIRVRIPIPTALATGTGELREGNPPGPASTPP